MLQAERTKITPAAACEHITSLWKLTDNGVAFQAALEQSGWTLARGDRRDFVVVDPKAGVHSLARRIDGATVNDVRARLTSVEIHTVQNALKLYRHLSGAAPQTAQLSNDACQQSAAAALAYAPHTGQMAEGLSNYYEALAECKVGKVWHPPQQAPAAIAVMPSQTCRVIGGNYVQCY